MLLSEFHTLLQEEVRRGTAFNTRIVSATRQAAAWLEQNYSFKYMERYVTFTLDPDAAKPRMVVFPEGGIKSIIFMKLRQDDGALKEIFQVDPHQVTAIESGEPSEYWIDGRENLWFDNTPDEEMTLEMSYVQFTSWPTDTAEEPWLCKWADGLLLAQTMLQLALPLRMDPKLYQMWASNRNEHLRALLLADDELRESNRSSVMNYGGTKE